MLAARFMATSTSASRPLIPLMAGVSVRISFLVNRPKNEEGFRLDRSEAHGRVQRYATRAYATDRPEGKRYT